MIVYIMLFVFLQSCKMKNEHKSTYLLSSTSGEIFSLQYSLYLMYHGNVVTKLPLCHCTTNSPKNASRLMAEKKMCFKQLEVSKTYQPCVYIKYLNFTA